MKKIIWNMESNNRSTLSQLIYVNTLSEGF